MQQHSKELTAWLEQELPWHGARIKFIALFLLALIRNKTVNFNRLSLDFDSDAASTSSYRRIQNFFFGFRFNQDLVAQLILKLLPPQEKYVLLMDRTNWRFGTLDINILLIAVHYHGIGIPLLWLMLPRAGNSNTGERQALMARLLQLIPVEAIEVFTADREFIGKSWFAYLQHHKVPFAIRIRHNSLCDGWFRVDGFFVNLPVEQARVLYQRYHIHGQFLAVAGMRLQGDYLIVVTNRNPHKALLHYRMRWAIERLFAALKTTGFDLETTHLRHVERIDKLLSLLALAFVWALKVGVYLHTSGKKRLKVKTHERWEKSLFRHGLDHLIFILNHINRRQQDFSSCLQLLSCT